MICLTPVQIGNPRYIGGSQEKYILVPCRKCENCVKKRALQWCFRLQQEEKVSESAIFLTLTYADGKVPISSNGLLTLRPKDHTDFMKRFRKMCIKNGAKKPLKYYMVGEYGSKTQRPHYHSILYNVPRFVLDRQGLIEQSWENGLIHIGEVTKASIAYTCGYVNKPPPDQEEFSRKHYGIVDDRVPQCSRMSKHLGENFLTKQRVKKMQRDLLPTLQIEDGKLLPYPDYYLNKVFTEEQKEEVKKKKKDFAKDHPLWNQVLINGIYWDDPKHQKDYIYAANNRQKKADRNRNKF